MLALRPILCRSEVIYTRCGLFCSTVNIFGQKTIDLLSVSPLFCMSCCSWARKQWKAFCPLPWMTVFTAQVRVCSSRLSIKKSRVPWQEVMTSILTAAGPLQVSKALGVVGGKHRSQKHRKLLHAGWFACLLPKQTLFVLATPCCFQTWIRQQVKKHYSTIVMAFSGEFNDKGLPLEHDGNYQILHFNFFLKAILVYKM